MGVVIEICVKYPGGRTRMRVAEYCYCIISHCYYCAVHWCAVPVQCTVKRMALWHCLCAVRYIISAAPTGSPYLHLRLTHARYYTIMRYFNTEYEFMLIGVSVVI
jgi:hypothetical protein